MKQKRDQVRGFASEKIAPRGDVPLVGAVAEALEHRIDSKKEEGRII